MKVVLGASHTCVLRHGKVKCFGGDDFGQLGYDHLQDPPNPLGVKPGQMGDKLPFVNLKSYAHDIDAGGHHTCAIVDFVKLKCWGKNFEGQLGLEDRVSRGDKPNDMDNLPFVNLGENEEVASISLGFSHSCVILVSGKLKCFGSNSFGQLGIGLDKDDYGAEPFQMGAFLPSVNLGEGESARVVAAGMHHTCVILDTVNLVKCFGSNLSGQLGIGDKIQSVGKTPESMGNNLPPIDFGSEFLPKFIDAGYLHNCVLLADDSMKCWGENFGQLGYGDSRDRGSSGIDMGKNLSQVLLGTDLEPVSFSLGKIHTCVVLNNKRLKCFGANSYGQLGLSNVFTHGDSEDSIGDELAFVSLGSGGNKILASVSVGGEHSCVRFTDDSMKCFGRNDMGQLGLGHNQTIGASVGDMGTNLSFVDLGNFPPDVPPVRTPNPTQKGATPRPTKSPTYMKDNRLQICSKYQTIDSCTADDASILPNDDEGSSIGYGQYVGCGTGLVCVWDTSEDVGGCICGHPVKKQGPSNSMNEFYLIPKNADDIAWFWGAIIAILLILLYRVSGYRRTQIAIEKARPRISSLTRQDTGTSVVNIGSGDTRRDSRLTRRPSSESSTRRGHQRTRSRTDNL